MKPPVFLPSLVILAAGPLPAGRAAMPLSQKISRMFWTRLSMLRVPNAGQKGDGRVRVWIWYFLLYSFAGFLLEVAFARLTRNPKRDRKCCYLLPLCPVYGLGAVLILAPAPLLAARPALLALWSALAATAAEYGMSLFYEKCLGVSFWDYAHLPWNLAGRVCLLFSVFWCCLGVGLVYAVHPLVAALVGAIPQWAVLPAVLVLDLDLVLTVYVLRKERSTDALLWYRRLPFLRLRERRT